MTQHELPDPPTPVVVRKVKNDGSERSRWEGELIAIDPDWLIVHHDARRHRRHKAALASAEGGVPAHGLRYLGRSQPLAVLFRFDEAGGLLEVQCDAAHPVQVTETTLTFVDLDVDLIVGPDGASYERDRDQFEANAARYGYDERSRATVDAAMTLALRLVRDPAPPLDGSAERLMARALGSTKQVSP